MERCCGRRFPRGGASSTIRSFMGDAKVSVVCVDIGSVSKDRFGWARTTSDGTFGGKSIDQCRTLLLEDISGGRRVALGIEAPGFLPVPLVSKDLGRGRLGEKDRSCFAPAGGYVATLGLHELLFLLQGIKGIPCTLDFEEWVHGNEGVLLWEAFVSGSAHTSVDDHAADAATASTEMFKRLQSGHVNTDVSVASPMRVFSLLGAALLWAGLTEDPRVLHSPALVVKPTTRFEGEVPACPHP